MTRCIEPATLAELPAIRAAYDHGRAMQRARRSVVWPPFPDAAIVREIDAGTLFRVGDATAMVGVFSMIDEDALIWGVDERGEHLYLHRIARAATYVGRGLVDVILRWVHDALITCHAAPGLLLVGERRLSADPRLAAHYHGIDLALLEAP